MPQLVVSISGHGFGHVAQTAPILNQLHERIAKLDITVRSSVPVAHLRTRIHVPFEHLPSDGDIGMLMSSALDVLAQESRAAYRAFHADWDARVDGEARLLRELGADMVFTNVGYLPLAGAQRASIPNVALCSLNWADIYRHCCGDDTITAQIYDSYASADAFLRATPGMAMTGLPNLIFVAPIAGRLPIERWPRIGGVHWLVQESWQVDHPDAIILETLQMSFSDLLASSDLLVCKPGYGSFVESASSSVPVLYVNRPDWPEAPALITWLQQNGLCREVSRDALEQGKIADVLEDIWNAPRPKPVIPEGAKQVAEWLAERLGS